MNGLITRSSRDIWSHIFGSFLEDFAYPSVAWKNEKLQIPMELDENEKEYFLKAELPGVEKEPQQRDDLSQEGQS